MTDKVFVEKANVRNSITWIDLFKEMGVDVVIIPRDRKDIFGHADTMVRYAGPNRVIFRAAQDDEDRKFMDGVIARFKQQRPFVKVEQFNFGKVKKPSEYNRCYINFLRVGDIIIMPLLSHQDCKIRFYKDESFSASAMVDIEIEEDEIALNQMRELFPQCEILGIEMFDVIANGVRDTGALNSLAWTIKSIV